MCDPVTLIAAATTAFGAMQSMQAGKAEESAMKHEAKQAEASAKFQTQQAEADAKAEKQLAQQKAEKIRKAAKAQQSSARAASAASGMDIGEGSALDISKSITQESEEDAGLTIFGGQDTYARGMQAGESYKLQGKQEASNLRAAGAAAKSKGTSDAISGLMSAGGTAYGAWKDMKGASAKTPHNNVGFNAKGGGARKKY